MIRAAIVTAVAMFAVGGIWYGALFAQLWGKIHGFDTLSPAEQKRLQSQTGPLYGLQAFVTLVSAGVLVYLVEQLGTTPYILAFWLWLGFVMPAQVSAVLFGGTAPRWMVSKTLVMTGEALVRLEVAAWVVSLFIK